MAPIVANSSAEHRRNRTKLQVIRRRFAKSISADPSIIQVMINRGRILMVLGTYMYAPLYSIDETWKRGKREKKVEISITDPLFEAFPLANSAPCAFQ